MRQLFRVVKSRSIKIWTNLFKSYIRPTLEYASEAWNTAKIFLKKDIKKVEKIQKYFSRILHSINLATPCIIL
jgi:hypothetical protein